ncbi:MULTISPECIES: hypothetical protein [unclassified Mesorhizobium]|jgi:hypothetical protein|uniref:Uncharacterized protein n=2 Tax=Rhizobium loti TaxID=381 RepID=A0A8E3B2L5_RHILI|nr:MULTISPECIES: hypothetical protein [unclassified Mesorhizobium]AZO41457.1 hypothetical protein EJ076_10165 [Mesorhizobium sp. M7D.F.Ca.US.005.01.1.1]PWJ87974.1 hypothetical protein C8D77_11363 [Mesorhizobium loti]RUX94834.1 hypothetical protein EN993_13950 [Mesorhizobium sp. M7D.F.Ca.US.004.01.2.1]RVA37223.1 hypothetical protein EN935_00205 [Mesorhizobium sp. M7D.F.Ca.US.004.03.1.1]
MTNIWLRYTALILPLLAWALSTQFGQIAPYIDCQRNGQWTAVSCGILLLVSVAGVVISRLLSTGTAKSERFIADAGFLVALAFVFALSLQGAATVLLDPCQR